MKTKGSNKVFYKKESFNIPHTPASRSCECDSHRGQCFNGPGRTEAVVTVHGMHEVLHEVRKALLQDAASHCAQELQLQGREGASAWVCATSVPRMPPSTRHAERLNHITSPRQKEPHHTLYGILPTGSLQHRHITPPKEPQYAWDIKKSHAAPPSQPHPTLP